MKLTTDKEVLRAMSPARRKAHRARLTATNAAWRVHRELQRTERSRHERRVHELQMRNKGNLIRAERAYLASMEASGEDWSDGLPHASQAFHAIIEGEEE